MSINVAFHELDDPKGLVRDVTGMGRWTYGDSELGLSDPELLPDAMGLVRQALERQLGNGEVEV